MVCHETLYQVIWRDKAIGGMLWKNLRHGHKNIESDMVRKTIEAKPNRVSVDKRPEILD
jgi:IS30 family transposase